MEKRKKRISFATEREAGNVLRELHSTAKIITDDTGIYALVFPRTYDMIAKTPTIRLEGEFYTADDKPAKEPKKAKGTWGGARSNSGAKPKGEVARITKSFMADADVVEILNQHKGTASDYINNAIRFCEGGTIYGYTTYIGNRTEQHVYRSAADRDAAADNVQGVDDIELFSLNLE